MEPTYLGLIQLMVSLLRRLTFHATPLATLSTLAFGALAVIAGFVARVCGSKASLPPRFVLDVLALWFVACASTVVWLKGVLILHSQGLA